MAEPSDTIAENIADVVDRHHAGTITKAQMATELSPLIAQLSPTLSELLTKITAFAGRVPGFLFFDGVPPADFGLVNAMSIDRNGKRIYGPKTEAGWGPAWEPSGTGGSLENLFRNPEWQLMNGQGPGYDGNPANLQAHLDSFDTEQNWAYTGVLPAINITNLAVSVNPSSGVVTVTATGDSGVDYLYPGLGGGEGSLIAFEAGAHAALRTSTMEVLTVNYTANTFTFETPRGLIPTAGAVTTACRPVMRADMGGASTHSNAGTGHGPDHWSKTPSAKLWIERFPTSTVGMTGSPGFTSHFGPQDRRLLMFMPTDNGLNYLYQQIEDVVELRGRQIVIGMYADRVANGTGNMTAVIDGVETRSTQSVTANGKTWIEMTLSVPDDAEAIDLGFVAENSMNAPWRLSQPMLAIGSYIGEGNYVPPARGMLTDFLVKQTPDSYFGASITFPPEGSGALGYGVGVNVFAETGGAIAKDVKSIRGQLEAVSGGTNRAISTRNTFNSNVRFGHIVHFAANGEKRGETGDFLISGGKFWLFNTVASASYTLMSMDMNSACLR